MVGAGLKANRAACQMSEEVTTTQPHYMKKLLFAVGVSACAFIQSASADPDLTVTIDTDVGNIFAIDVVWNPTFVPGALFADEASGGFGVGSPGHGGQWGDYNSWIWVSVNAPGISILEIVLSPDRHLTDFCTTYDSSLIPTVSVIDDGLGVHLVYDFSTIGSGSGDNGSGGGDSGGSGSGDNGGGDSGDGQAVPDGGSPLVLLGASLAVMGLVRFHSGGCKAA